MPLSYVVSTNNPSLPNLKTIEDVKTGLTDLLTQEIGKSYVTYAWNGNDLVLNVNKLGRSEVLVGISGNPDGSVQIYEKNRSLAWTHRAFAGQAEGLFDNLLKKRLNAKKVA